MKSKIRPEVLPESKRRQQRYVWLNVLPDDIWVKVRPGKTLWEALQNTNIYLEGECGGLGKCGKCKVRVLSTGIGRPSVEEERLLDRDEIDQGVRLACRTPVHGDMVVSTAESEVKEEYFQILSTSHVGPAVHRPPLRLKPLVEKRGVAFSSDLQYEWLSDLDRIRIEMGPEHQDLKATLGCLLTLHDMLIQTKHSGTAVFHNNTLLAWQTREEIDRQYGLVFDVGTSTVVGKLINMLNGTEVAVASCLNSQYKYGPDVISRLNYIMENPKGLGRLHNLILRDLNRITRSLLKTARVTPAEIFVAVAAGNSTMQHIMLGLDPSGIAQAPFAPILTDGLVVEARDVGLELHSEALCYAMPIKSGYIGGDLVSVILASGAAEQDAEIILGMDLGTNGEILLGNRKRLMTCSAAAGPALEGARISHGMIASAGAIEGVSLEEGKLQYKVIGNVSPIGICGSGLVELVAVLINVGIISPDGLIQRSRRKIARELNPRVTRYRGVKRFLVASAEESGDGKPIYLSQRDVREVQLAKAAIAAGIHTLMDQMEVAVTDIDRVYFAGALGNYVNPERAMDIGLIPPFPPDRVASLGNAASTGAMMVMLNEEYWHMANELAKSIEHIELSSRLDFNQHFVENMDFPRGG
jgi:uncharacterized 2Fe-2S/4Fe-4S cluster protein (DUF4445 family)